MFLNSSKARLGRAAGVVGAVGTLALLATTGSASAAYTFCDGCTLTSGAHAESYLLFHVSSVYAHNLGSADRRLGVAISGSSVTYGTNTAYATYGPQAPAEGAAYDADVYNIHMNAHLDAPGV
jgi:hypothetical protein